MEPVMAQAQLLEDFEYDDAAYDARGLQVLVVEDDMADAYLIRRALAGNPRVDNIAWASDGIEALALLDSGAIHPDLAIIDLHMPRKNGLSLLVELSCRDLGDLARVVLTSSKASSDSVRSKLRGAHQYLTKPDTIDEMETVLSGVIAAL
jgi:CheY-like chemotaxis protein